MRTESSVGNNGLPIETKESTEKRQATTIGVEGLEEGLATGRKNDGHAPPT